MHPASLLYSRRRLAPSALVMPAGIGYCSAASQPSLALNPTHSHTDRREAWSRYWASGALHSCPGSFAENYDGAVAAVWREQFQALSAPARVLEIGAGNGALAKLFLEQPQGAAQQSQLDAVDLAELVPAWLAKRSDDDRRRVRFHPGMRAEALPFEDDSFDLIISQYGFEYAERGPASAELLRVLKPGGRVCLVLHHSSSRVVEVAREELGHYRALQAEGGLIELCADLLPLFAMAGSPEGRARLAADPAANALRARFNQAQQQLDQRVAGSRFPDLLHEVREALGGMIARAGQGELGVAQGRLAELRVGLTDADLRTREVVDCALDEQDVTQLGQALSATAQGTAQRVELRHESGHLLGWVLIVGAE